MPVIKIARRSIAAIEPLEKPVTYYDDALKASGFSFAPRAHARGFSNTVQERVDAARPRSV